MTNYGKTVAARRYRTLPLRAAALIAVVVVAAAQAQVTNEVRITMKEPCNRSAPKIVTVALTVRQTTMLFQAKRDDESMPWVGNTGGTTFPADRATASLRFEGTRTASQTSSPGKNARLEDVAVFSFVCNQQTALDVNISTNGPVPVSFLRKCRGCIEEHDHFDGGSKPYPVASVWVPGEELRVSLDVSDPRFGLLVFSSNPNAEDSPVFSLDTNAKGSPGFSLDPRNRLLVFGRRPKQNMVGAVLQRGDIASAVMKQRFKKGTGSKLLENETSIENTRLHNAGVQTLTLMVQ